MDHVWSATSKVGKIYIGDPCYAMREDVYYDVWGKDTPERAGFQDGEMECEGVTFAIGGTAHGDGEYLGSDGTRFGVDAGVIGAVPFELVDEAKLAGYKTPPGLIVNENEVVLEYSDEGMYEFKTAKGRTITAIDTASYEDEDEDEDDENEYCSECGRHVGPHHDGGLCDYCAEEEEGEELDESTVGPGKRCRICGKPAVVNQYIPHDWIEIDPTLNPRGEDLCDSCGRDADHNFIPSELRRSRVHEAYTPKVKWYLMERDNPQLGTYWVKKGALTRSEAPKKSSQCVYGGATYHVFDTEEEYNAKIAELEASGAKIH